MSKYILIVILLFLSNVSYACYDSTIQKPTPFMGNNGEVFILSDGSIWEVKYEYEYLYEYYPSVVICPDQNLLIIDGKNLNVVNVSGGSSGSSRGSTPNFLESNVDGSWEGWQGGTIVKLINGQIWQQAGLHLSLSLGLSPSVMIFQKGGMYFMQIDGESEPVWVQRLQ